MTAIDSMQARDLLDNLRLDFDVSGGQEKAESIALVNQVHDLFIGKWGAHIPENKLEIASLAIHEPIQTDNTGMSIEVSPQKGLSGLMSGLNNHGSVDGQTEHIDNFRFIKQYAYKKGIERFPKKQLDSVIEMYKTKLGLGYEEAKEHFARAYFQSIHAHESAHVCSDESVPTWFQEIGSRYYQSEVITEIYGNDELQPADVITSHDFYTELISQYGDDVHKYFFGGEINSKIRSKILLRSLGYITKNITKDIFTIPQ